MTRAALLALLLLAPALAGCLGEDAPAADAAPDVARTAADAGARAGEAPAGPTAAYAVKGELTAHPMTLPTNEARPPVVVDASGVFKQEDCRPLNFGPFEGLALHMVSDPQRPIDLSAQVRVGDVFQYNITLSFTNSADNWAEIRAAYGFGSTVGQHTESTRELTDVVISWEGQGYRASEEDMAWAFVGCFLGQMSRPIPYTFTISLSFAEGAVPAEAPILLPVPAGATTLIVRGVPVDASQGVLSHFRLFGPDDRLLCECALSSQDEVALVPLTTSGDHVLIVDHTANGFVSVALDVPPADELRALQAEWVVTPVHGADGGPVDATVEVSFERVPLFMAAFVQPKDGAGLGKRTQLTVTNARGTPLHMSWGGHLAWTDPIGGNAWLGFWPTDWAFQQDHHAYAEGAHLATIQSEGLRGEVALVTRHYVR